jgi:hypothetical protein
MEPKLPTPNLGPEFTPSHSAPSPERVSSLPTPENAVERGVERVEQRGEMPPTPVVAAPILPPPVVAPTPPPPVADAAGAPQTDDLPMVANDDDLIEKEWVDKAKKIITQTKDDPYRREREVGKLQADYLLKRYGKELGAQQ